MVYTPPTTRDTGDFITAPIYNVDLVNNLIALKALIDALDTTVSQNSTSITNNTSTLTNQTLNIGQLGQAFNMLINPNMDFWQRGTSRILDGTDPYLADRWRMSNAGNNNDAGEKVVDGIGTLQPNALINCLRVKSRFGTSTLDMRQVVESQYKTLFHDRYLVFTGWIKFSGTAASFPGAGNFSAQILGNTGTADQRNAGGYTFLGSKTITPLTTWQRFQVVTSAKVASTINNVAVRLQFANATSLGETKWYQITRLQLQGLSVDPGETEILDAALRPLETERRLCQRYFWQIENHPDEIASPSSHFFFPIGQAYRPNVGLNDTGNPYHCFVPTPTQMLDSNSPVIGGTMALGRLDGGVPSSTAATNKSLNMSLETLGTIKPLSTGVQFAIYNPGSGNTGIYGHYPIFKTAQPQSPNLYFDMEL